MISDLAGDPEGGVREIFSVMHFKLVSSYPKAPTAVCLGCWCFSARPTSGSTHTYSRISVSDPFRLDLRAREQSLWQALSEHNQSGILSLSRPDTSGHVVVVCD